MLNSKRFTIILSIIIAMILWIYVIGETNPIDNKTYKNIPINYINQEYLDKNNLSVLETSDLTLNVTISGTRSALAKVSESEIIATVDLSDASEGSNDLKIKVTVPESVQLEDKSINRASVIVEKTISRDVDIEVVYEGKFADDAEPVTVETDKVTVSVIGAKTQVNKVDHAKAVVQADKISETMKTFKRLLVPVDKNGDEVENVKLSFDTVKITVMLAKTKTVTLNVPIINDNKEILKTISVPKTITIKGKADVLDKIDSVTAKPIDISSIIKSSVIVIDPILPEGAEVSEKSSDLVLIVTVEKTEDKTFSFDDKSIHIKNLNENLVANFDSVDIEVIITGRKEDIDQIRKEDITLTADLSDLSEGIHHVALEIYCNGDYSKIEVSPKKVYVNIE